MKSLVKQVTVYDEDTGEIVNEVTSRGSPNGRGWVIMYSDRTSELFKQCTGSVARVFGYLACNQNFEERGFIGTKKNVQEALGMTKSTCIEAFKWLKEHHIISEVNHNGVSEFLINPDYVTVGRDKRKRQKAWVKSFAGQTVATIEAPKSVHRARARVASSALPPSGRSIEIE